MQTIAVENVSKKFKIGFKKNQSALERVLSFFSGKQPEREIWVLKNVSFTANTREIIGIIGPNGAGKSTLLRIIAGIYEADSGTVRTDKKIVSLIGLQAGLQARLTMKDNIYMCCPYFGLSEKTIKQRFDSITKFAELESFVDTKIYQFSSGMVQRLAFSMAIHCDPEILLLDEVFGVGDENFKERSSQHIQELARKGATVLLVTHNVEMINKNCGRILHINGGILEHTEEQGRSL